MFEKKDLEAFFTLLKAGLWENLKIQGPFFRIHDSSPLDWQIIYRLAEEQSVLGLVLAGLEHSDIRPPQELLLQLIGEVQLIEQQNKAMNIFVAKLIEKMRNKDVYAILVKGQGLAQCYERPLWRACGDIDLLLSDNNYQKAGVVLRQVATTVNEENPYNLHFAMTIESWSVELHGTLRGLLKKRIDKGIDNAQDTIFYEGKVRSWMNANTLVFLPRADEDVVFVFCHLLQHFFKERILLRQICDWCRLLWTYHESLDHRLLEKRIREMGIMTEWKAFALVAVKYMGMPKEAMPLYSHSSYWARKGDKILNYIIKSGHNIDTGYCANTSYMIRKAMSFWQHTKVGFEHFVIFPMDTLIVWGNMVKFGVKVVLRRKQ